MVAELLNKYVWLLQIFINAGTNGLSLDEILDKWEYKWGTEYSRRSFNNHRNAVEEVFGIRIECNRSTNRYFIRYSADAADMDQTTAWIINTFSIGSLASLSKERLSGRVSVENIPSGQVWLTAILDAMQQNRCLEIGHRKYTSADTSYYTVRPYAVKEDAKRWYLIGFCEQRKDLRVYGLDRIASLEILDKQFILPKNFDVDDMFATTYGIYLNMDKGLTIRFRAYGHEAGYLRDLPIHSSQKEHESGEGWTDFSIFVAPNDNLIMEFCKRGARVEVLSPKDVREKVANELKKGYELYR